VNNVKVLIIDDKPQIRETIKRMLRELVSEFAECSDGVDALRTYSTFHPDWVLMDIKMKTVDGLTATREITSQYPDAQIVIVTSYDEPELREAARAAGACDYVIKENLFALHVVLASKAQKTA
jgi:CheY-like chemotaxis protein